MIPIVRYRQILASDGYISTEIWVNGSYSRIQAALTVEQALAAVYESRKRFLFRDDKR